MPGVVLAAVLLVAACTGADDSGAADATTTSSAPPSVTIDGEPSDGAEVVVRGSGYLPGVDVGVTVCAAGVEETLSLDECALDQVVAAHTSSSGAFTASLTMHRYVFVPAIGELDCGTAELCVVAAADIADISHGGVIEVTVAGDGPPAPDLRVETAEDPDGIALRLRVVGSGFAPNALMNFVQCPALDDVPYLDACVYGSSVQAVADAGGAIAVELEAYEQVDTRTERIDCLQPGACVITNAPPAPGQRLLVVPLPA